MIPWPYLKGISTGDFSAALAAFLGREAAGLSASTGVRLQEVRPQEFAAWNKRSLTDKRYAYFWVDGVPFNVRLEDAENQRPCILVVMGATPEGKKELVVVQDGYRGSEPSWKELLLDLKARGLEHGPELAIGDGALGFWKAIRQGYGETGEQRCWVHKTANVLHDLPKGKQPQAKSMRHDLWMAATKGCGSRIACLTMVFKRTQCPEASWRSLNGSNLLPEVIQGARSVDGLKQQPA